MIRHKAGLGAARRIRRPGMHPAADVNGVEKPQAVGSRGTASPMLVTEAMLRRGGMALFVLLRCINLLAITSPRMS